ncbi:MAG: DUF3237 domain-containing protein [Acidimicrobiales bacterium]
MEAPRLEFAMAVQLAMTEGRHDIGPLPSGGRRWALGVAGGRFEGPRLSGEVLPGGGEWPHLRPDGVLAINARYCLKERDGTIIYLENRGFRWAYEPKDFERWLEGRGGGASGFYMRVTPTFEVPEGPHDWLTRHVFVGVLGDGEAGVRGPFIRYYQLL